MLHRLSFWSIPMWAVAGTSLEWACVVPIFLHRPTWHSNFNQNQPRACFKYFLFWWIFSNSHHKALSHGTSTLETPSSCVTPPESFKQTKFQFHDISTSPLHQFWAFIQQMLVLDANQCIDCARCIAGWRRCIVLRLGRRSRRGRRRRRRSRRRTVSWRRRRRRWRRKTRKLSRRRC